MKSALVVLGLLPCLLALSLVHFVSAQTLTERVNQLLQSFVSGVDFPLQSSCPQLEDLSEQCRREFFGGVGSQAAVFCTGDCYRPVLEAYRSCSETANALTATAAGFIVHLIQAGELITM